MSQILFTLTFYTQVGLLSALKAMSFESYASSSQPYSTPLTS